MDRDTTVRTPCFQAFRPSVDQFEESAKGSFIPHKATSALPLTLVVCAVCPDSINGCDTGGTTACKAVAQLEPLIPFEASVKVAPLVPRCNMLRSSIANREASRPKISTRLLFCPAMPVPVVHECPSTVKEDMLMAVPVVMADVMVTSTFSLALSSAVVMVTLEPGIKLIRRRLAVSTPDLATLTRALASRLPVKASEPPL